MTPTREELRDDLAKLKSQDALAKAGRSRRKALRKLLDQGLSYRAALAQVAKRPEDADELEEREYPR